MTRRSVSFDREHGTLATSISSSPLLTLLTYAAQIHANSPGDLNGHRVHDSFSPVIVGPVSAYIFDGCCPGYAMKSCNRDGLSGWEALKLVIVQLKSRLDRVQLPLRRRSGW